MFTRKRAAFVAAMALVMFVIARLSGTSGAETVDPAAISETTMETSIETTVDINTADTGNLGYPDCAMKGGPGLAEPMCNDGTMPEFNSSCEYYPITPSPVGGPDLDYLANCVINGHSMVGMNIMSGVQATMSVTTLTASAGFTASADGTVDPAPYAQNQLNSFHEFAGSIEPICVEERGTTTCMFAAGGHTFKLDASTSPYPDQIYVRATVDNMPFSINAGGYGYNVDASGIVNCTEVPSNTSCVPLYGK